MPDDQQPESPTDGDDTATSAAPPAREAAADREDVATAKADAKADAKAGEKADAKADEKATAKSTGKTGAKSGVVRPAPLFSVYGLLSTVLGLASVAALVFGLITWSMHRNDVDERAYRSRVLQTAASWTSVLINLNAENVEKGMQRLHDKTVGQLNREFEGAVQPYREVVQRIQSRSTGRIEAVAIATLHGDAGPEADGSADTEGPLASHRTDPVMVVATSIAENVGGKPQTVHWALQLDVTDVDGQMLISRLRSIR